MLKACEGGPGTSTRSMHRAITPDMRHSRFRIFDKLLMTATAQPRTKVLPGLFKRSSARLKHSENPVNKTVVDGRQLDTFTTTATDTIERKEMYEALN